jgi:hypothetical protein
VHSLHSFQIVFGEIESFLGIGEEESIVCVSRGVLLRLEKGVKIPERALNKVVCGHFLEAVIAMMRKEEKRK